MNVTPVERVERVTPTEKGFERQSGFRLAFKYASARDKVDSNLLLFLHGLGDTARPFFELGTQLQQTLPQSAILSIQAPMRVPLLEEEAWMWWESFDSLGERKCNCTNIQSFRSPTLSKPFNLCEPFSPI